MTVASLKRLAASGAIKSDELTVAFITGIGFRTLEAVIDTVSPLIHIQPTMGSFEEAVRGRVNL